MVEKDSIKKGGHRQSWLAILWSDIWGAKFGHFHLVVWAWQMLKQVRLSRATLEFQVFQVSAGLKVFNSQVIYLISFLFFTEIFGSKKSSIQDLSLPKKSCVLTYLGHKKLCVTDLDLTLSVPTWLDLSWLDLTWSKLNISVLKINFGSNKILGKEKFKGPNNLGSKKI